MNVATLSMIFGHDQWQGPCVVVMDAEAAMQVLGVDSIVGGGAKNYAPRMVSGRIAADDARLTQDGSLTLVRQERIRATTGEETLKQTVIVADASHVVAIEFPDTAILANLGLDVPPARGSGSHHGISKLST